jgi:hypothetical protein
MTEAPATGTNFYVMHIGGTTQSSTTLPGGSTVPGDFNVSGDSTVLGKIAIGTTTLNRDVHISTGRPDIRLTDTTDNSYSEIVYNANSFSIQVDPDQTVDSSAFIVKTDGTTRIRVDSNGLQFGTGTAAANYLDDYEEGIHVTTFAGTGTVGLSSNSLQYTKVGRTVTIGGQVLVSSQSGVSGGIRLTLPFAAYGLEVGPVRLYGVNYTATAHGPICYTSAGHLEFAMSRDNSASTDIPVTTNGYYMFGITYQTS